jgi:protocatechuate 4,5-dioxygenase alpha subunit
MDNQINPQRSIPDTSVFDLRSSFKGYRINKLANSLNTPENRNAFKADEEAYMARFGLTDEEKALIRKRDFNGLIDAGGNIYYLIKIGFCTGFGLYRMGAQMRGETYEQFLETRKDKGAI